MFCLSVVHSYILESIINIVKVPTAPKDEWSNEGPEIDEKAEPGRAYLDSSGGPRVLEVLCVSIAWTVCIMYMNVFMSTCCTLHTK